MKHYLIEQVELAIADKPGDYVKTDRHYVFTVPTLKTVWKICCVNESDEYRINRLNWFINKIKKSPAFKNVRGVPQV